MRKLKTKWIGLKMNPPLLLPIAPVSDINRDKEEEEWEETVKTKGYYEKQDITRYIAWDIRQKHIVSNNKTLAEGHNDKDCSSNSNYKKVQFCCTRVCKIFSWGV
jgi:hypothetical protein